MKDDHMTIDLSDLGFPEKGVDPDVDKKVLEAFAQDLANEIDTPMKNPSVSEDGDISKGTNRIILSEEELVETLMQLSPRMKKLTLPIYETEPTVHEEQLEGIDEYERASYRTYFDGSVDGRVTNIQLSADAINGYVLGPGDQFAFNKVVGERR